LLNDELFVKTIGNIVQEPKIVTDAAGNKICCSKLATNPRAIRYDPRTGQRVPDDERNEHRTFVELRILKPSAAEKFSKLFRKGDRIWVEGEAYTIQIPQLFRSNKRKALVSLKVDIDEDGKLVETIMQDRLALKVFKFGKVIIDVEEGTSMMTCNG
jgi:single-stranded DNA-binding protein